MRLTLEHIDFIRSDLRLRGVLMEELVESLVDHICCAMENHEASDFEKVYQQTLNTFGPNGISKIQQETTYLLTIKQQITMNRLMYVFAYLAAFLCSTGLLFKLNHWVGANIMLTIGVVLFNFGFLPIYFYIRYQKAIQV